MSTTTGASSRTDGDAEAPQVSTDAPTPDRRRNMVRVTAILVALLAVATVVVGWQSNGVHRADDARTEGLAAARDLVPRLLSYDYRTLPAESAQNEANTTGDFAGEYRDLMENGIRPRATEQQFVTEVQARDASVVSAQPGTLTAMLYLSQVTTSTALAAPRLDSSSVRVTLVEDGGRWLVSDLDRV